VTAVLGILSCLFLAWQNFKPMIDRALADDPVPLTILGVYALVGAIVYAAYGYWNSKLAKGIDITEDSSLPTPAEAMGRGVDDIRD
jgi:APA family basic amino acid/polyamine antiporter